MGLTPDEKPNQEPTKPKSFAHLELLGRKYPKIKVTIFILITAFATYMIYQFVKVQQEYAEQQNPAPLQYRTAPSPTNSGLQASKLGEVINLGDRRLIVYGFQPHSEPMMRQFFGSSSGLAMDVLIENISDSPFRSSPLNFTVQDADGRALTYYDVTPGGKRPRLESEQIAPGQKVRAYITYADNRKPFVVYYKSLDGKVAKISAE